MTRTRNNTFVCIRDPLVDDIRSESHFRILFSSQVEFQSHAYTSGRHSFTAPAYIRKTRPPPKWTFSTTMDKTTSVIAALKAGKQPSQLQTNAWIEKLLQSELIQVEKTAGAGELSQNGKKLARDLRDILEAYKGYVSHKNGMISPPLSLLALSIPY